MREKCGAGKEAGPQGSETDNLEIICGTGRAGKKKKKKTLSGQENGRNAERREDMKTQRGGGKKKKGSGRGNKQIKAEVKHQKQKQALVTAATLTEANETQGFATDAGGAGRHLADLLHALDPRALTESLVEPGVPPVEVEDVADGGVCRLLHSRRGNVAHSDAWRKKRKKKRWRSFIKTIIMQRVKYTGSWKSIEVFF